MCVVWCGVVVMVVVSVCARACRSVCVYVCVRGCPGAAAGQIIQGLRAVQASCHPDRIFRLHAHKTQRLSMLAPHTSSYSHG